MISKAFFARDPVSCARELIGARLVWGRCAGVIVETEAYAAENDEACHTFFRPSTRDFVSRNSAGTSYVYLNYGVHWMLNVLVKGRRNGFVLIRALEPIAGIKKMESRRRVENMKQLCSGPGKLTQALEISGKHHEIDLCRDRSRCFVAPATPIQIVADGRIGISRATALPWRFTLKGSEFLSARVRPLR